MEFFPSSYLEEVRALCLELQLPDSLAWQIYRRGVKEWHTYGHLCFHDKDLYWSRLLKAIRESVRMVDFIQGEITSRFGLLYWFIFDANHGRTNGRSLLLGRCFEKMDTPSLGVEVRLGYIPKIMAEEARKRRATLDRCREMARADALRHKMESRRQRGSKG